MEEQYRMKPGAFAEVRPRVLKRMALMLTGLAALLTAQAYYMSTTGNDLAYLVLAPVAVLLGFTAVRTIRRQQAIFESYQLIVTPEVLTRTQEHVLPIALPVADIRGIVQNSNGSLLIQGRDLNHSIGVPAQLEDFSALRAHLATLRPITDPAPQPNARGWGQIALSVLMLPALGLLLWSDNKWVVGVAGPVGAALFIRNGLLIHRSRHIDQRIKSARWVYVLLTIIIIGVTLTKLLVPAS